MRTGLYAGTGAPWAGQESDREDADTLARLEMEDSAGNLGAEPPTGSIRGIMVRLACRQGRETLVLDKRERMDGRKA